MPGFLAHWIDAWTSIYSNSSALRTSVGFAHIAGLVAGGGTAIALDRATLAAWRRGSAGRIAHARVVARAHRVVIGGLAVVIASGLLLLAADLDTYLDSRVFWLKMGLVLLLMLNGGLLAGASRRVAGGSDRAWRWLRTASLVSLCLWFATTLLGAALPNV
jgi:hypothetical protein